MTSSNWPYHITSEMQKLERELSASKAEVERLREEANNWHGHYRDEANNAQKFKQAYIEQEKEVQRLSKYVEMLEIFSPENEWDRPKWRRLVGSKEENENPKTLRNLYQLRIATTPEQVEEMPYDYEY
jgi:hypothetical protein